MLDDDDIDFVILASSPTTWFGFIILVAVVVGMLYVVSGNKDECLAKTCPAGLSGRLLDHECLCVGRPVEDGGRP